MVCFSKEHQFIHEVITYDKHLTHSDTEKLLSRINDVLMKCMDVDADVHKDII